nr:hypothetical protein [Tanacetum cinerariifolium]
MQQPMQNPEDILDPTTAIDMALVLMAKAFTLNDTTPTNNNQRSSLNPSNMQIAQPDINIDQDRQMLMVEDNVENQFRPNAVQNVKNQVVLNAVQNSSVQNVRNQNGLSIHLGIASSYGIENVVIAQAKGNHNGINENQIRCYNSQGVNHYTRKCIVKPRKKDVAYLQTQLQIAQKKEAGIQLNSEEFNFMAVVGSYDETGETDSAPIYDLDGPAKEAAKFVQKFKSLTKEANESLAKDKALEFKIKHLLRAVVSQDIMSIMQNNSVIDTSNLQTELEFPSNSISTPQESKGVNNDKVIAPGMFRINHSMTFREEKHVPNTVSVSAMRKPITVSQPPVITRKYVNSDINGLSSTGVDNTKTRKPPPRSNTKHDKVPSASKSSRNKNKEAEVEDHHRNLLLSKNNKLIYVKSYIIFLSKLTQL